MQSNHIINKNYLYKEEHRFLSMHREMTQEVPLLDCPLKVLHESLSLRCKVCNHTGSESLILI